jgi:chemotaxis family two-component system response regulator Rcp1
MGAPVMLYVEDEDAAVFLLETALKEMKMDVELYRVSNGDDALAFLNRTGVYRNAPRPDLVLLDLNLPRKGGLEVLAEIQGNEALGDLSVIVFTSSSLATDRKKSLALGAQEYITKPSSFDGFLTAIKTVCAYLPAS